MCAKKYTPIHSDNKHSEPTILKKENGERVFINKVKDSIVVVYKDSMETLDVKDLLLNSSKSLVASDEQKESTEESKESNTCCVCGKHLESPEYILGSVGKKVNICSKCYNKNFMQLNIIVDRKLKNLQNEDKTPSHYNFLIQPTDVIKEWNLDFLLGSATKYISRLGRKDGEHPIKELNKIIHYCEMKIKELENENNNKNN